MGKDDNSNIEKFSWWGLIKCLLLHSVLLVVFNVPSFIWLVVAVVFNDTGYHLVSVLLDPILILSALHPLFIVLTIYYLVAKNIIKAKYKLNVIKGIMASILLFYLFMLSLSYAPESLLAKTGEFIFNIFIN